MEGQTMEQPLGLSGPESRNPSVESLALVFLALAAALTFTYHLTAPHNFVFLLL